MTPGEQAKKARELGISLTEYRARQQSLEDQLNKIPEGEDEPEEDDD